MKKSLKLAAPLVAALAVAACNGGSSAVPGVSGPAGPQAAHIPLWQATHTARAACVGDRIHHVQCDALISTQPAGSSPSGLTAANLEAAYNLPSKTGGKGQSVYIVDIDDNPNVASDLATYRSTFGLPKAKFNKYNQEGQKSNYPPPNQGWGVEIDLDVEMASASCPNCTINLIEAIDPDVGEAEAVKLGATIVSNSYTGGGLDENDYNTPGVTYLASSGDSGYGLVAPATFQDVVAVGGTFLQQNSNYKRGWREVVWPDTGGGCSSTHEAKPSWQHDPDCSYRTGSDIAAVGAVEVAEYDTFQENGWFEIGGTSVSSPLVAGMYALAGNSTKQHGGENLWKLSKKHQRKEIYAITLGNDGSCNSEYLCTAGTKQFGIYSGPTGWGTPHGVGAL